MRNGYFTKLCLSCLLLVAAGLAGCVSMTGCVPMEKYEKTLQLSAPLEAGKLFAAETHNGSITTAGTDADQCSLTATIIARAGSQEEAKKLADQVKVTLEHSGGGLTAKIKKPAFMQGKSVCVNLDVTVPNHTGLELNTHNGAVKIANITGQINARTHNGSVTAESVSGSTSLRTHNGRITCSEISGEARLKTHNGSVEVVYSASAEAVCNADVETHNGSIQFTSPPGISAAIDISTHNGSINTDLPITIIGKVGKTNLKGTIGKGKGKLRLQTHNGSIRIK